ncbi:MAG: DUF3570 domain-containing protein [Saprospiraceae bacterium]|nr:DUF3570 domain-containing protein [Saprospiraceae bacterium]
MIKRIVSGVFLMLPLMLCSQSDSTEIYRKRVLESVELDFLSSYYEQSGANAAVTGGIGTEQLDDATGTIVVSIPIKTDAILKIDAGVSAYSSASSSNVNPFDGQRNADPFVASSGESKSDLWSNLSVGYVHHSFDRNRIWSGKLSLSAEYDYTSIGISGSHAWLLNRKNTEFGLRASAFFDTWSRIYPIELRGPEQEDDEDEGFDLRQQVITGNPNYQPRFTELPSRMRNSYAVGFDFSQILSRKLQASISIDMVLQKGLLSTPFQRVYFADIEDSFVEGFHLADDIERMPATRFKVAIGGRAHYFVHERLAIRSFARYFVDDWGIRSITTSIELPIKIGDALTVYPSYRFYQQSASNHFNHYNQHQSTQQYYTSDFDLAQYTSSQWGLGASYTDRFSRLRLGPARLKSIDLKYYRYDRNTSFSSSIVTLGVKLSLSKNTK